MKYLLTILLITSCGVDESTLDIDLAQHEITIDSELQQYVDEWEAWGLGEVKFDVYFSDDLPKKYLGICTTIAGVGQRVRISTRKWDKLHSATRWVLLFHELNHCVNNAPHDESVGVDGYPATLMLSQMPHILDVLYMFNNKEVYIEGIKSQFGVEF